MTDQRILASAVNRYRRLSLSDCFDPSNVDSRPTETQRLVLSDLGKVPHRYVLGGNQSGKCLISQTFLATPRGPVAIEDIEVGDLVYSEEGKPIKVLAKKYQGRQVVLPILKNNKVVASATANHRWLSSKGYEITTEDLLDGEEQIKRVFIKSSLGSVRQSHAYAIGALLGDGCSADGVRNNFIVSSEDSLIPTRIAEVLGRDIEVTKQKGDNFNWILKRPYGTGTHYSKVKCAHYDAWGVSKKAHEKIADLDVIREWDRESLKAYLAGLLDTDGSVYSSKSNKLVIKWSMQAKSVIDSIHWALLALWQYDSTIDVDNRDKYVNGPVYGVGVTHCGVARRILEDLDQYLVTPRKKFKIEYTQFSSENKTDWVNNKIRHDRIREADTWDIEVDSNTHLFLLANGMVSHNSQLGARETSWVFTETHPTWKRPADWGDEPLLILVSGQTTKQVEEVLWRKIQSFLEEGTYSIQKIGNTIQKVIHNETKNTIIFLSHHAASEAQKKAASYVCHYVWLDEMPGTVKFIEELHRRVQTRRGPFLATFTPKVINSAIRRLVDRSEMPLARRYRLKAFDNPVYDDEQKQHLLASIASYSRDYQLTILEGDWATGEQAVYFFDPETMVEAPKDYSPSWRHVESSDPATESKFGLTLWAEDPRTGTWYCIRDDYLSGIYVPLDIYKAVRERTAGYNVVRRVSDPAATWYIHTANSQGTTYMTPWNKNSRKAELIKGLQTAVAEGAIKVAPWCNNLIEEFISCQWSDTAPGKIVNSSSYHLLDSAQYFVDCRPKRDPSLKPTTWHAELREGNEKRKRLENKKKARTKVRGSSRWLRTSARR